MILIYLLFESLRVSFSIQNVRQRQDILKNDLEIPPWWNIKCASLRMATQKIVEAGQEMETEFLFTK